MSADPNTSIRVGGVSIAYGDNGELLTKATSAVNVYATTAAIVAIALSDTARVDGNQVESVSDYSKWTYEAASTAAADAWHLVPTVQASSAGVWVRRSATLLELSSTAATLGSNLLGDSGTGHWKTAAVQTTTFTAAIDTLYYLALTSAAVINLPALDTYVEGRRVGFVNNGTTAGVLTAVTAGGDAIGGASAATAAGPSAGTMKTYVACKALNRWVAWA